MYSTWICFSYCSWVVVVIIVAVVVVSFCLPRQNKKEKWKTKHEKSKNFLQINELFMLIVWFKSTHKPTYLLIVIIHVRIRNHLLYMSVRGKFFEKIYVCTHFNWNMFHLRSFEFNFFVCIGGSTKMHKTWCYSY